MSAPSIARGEAFQRREFAFRIDEEKAFAKLRDFRVAEPERYVLELILAGLVSGATRIEVDSGVWTVAVRFDGPSFERDDLEGLYHHLIEEGEGGTTRLSHLASGLIMLSHLRPRKVVVHSGAVRLTETFEDPKKPVRAIEDADLCEGTEIVVSRQRRWRPMQWLGFRDTDEEAVVRERVVRPPVEILLDGKPLEPRPLALAVSEEVAEGDVTGTLGLTEDYSRTAPLWVCYRGVLVQDRTYAGVAGVLSSPRIRRNISLNGVVQDEPYAALLEQAKRMRRPLERALAARRLVAQGPQAARDPLVHRLMTRLLPFKSLPDGDPLRVELERLPVLETVGGQPISLAQLIAQLPPETAAYRRRKAGDEGPALFCARADAVPTPRRPLTLDGQDVVVVPDAEGERSGLRSLVERCFVDRSEALQAAAARDRFMGQRPLTAELTGEAFLVAPVDSAVGRGQLGLQLRGSASVRLLHQGRPLDRITEGLVQGLVGVLDCPQLTPNDTWSGAVEGEALEAVRALIHRHAQALVLQLAEQLKTGPQALGDPYPVQWLVLRMLGHRALDEPARAALDALPLVENLRGEWVSLNDLRALAPTVAAIARVTPRSLTRLKPDSRAELLALTAGTHVRPEAVLVLTETHATQLGFGSGCLDEAFSRGHHAVHQAGRRARPDLLTRTWPDLAGAPATAVEGDTVRGELVVGAGPGPEGLVWMVGDRVITEPTSEAAWLPPRVRGWVAGDGLQVTLDRSDVVRRGDAWEQARLAVQRAVLRGLEDAPDESRLAIVLYHYEWHTTDRRFQRRRKWTALEDTRRTVALDEDRLLPDPSWLTRALVPCLDGVTRSLQALGEGSSPRLAYVLAADPSALAPVTLPDRPVVALVTDHTVRCLRGAWLLDNAEPELQASRQRAAFLETTATEEPVLPPGIAGPRRVFQRHHDTLGAVRGEVALTSGLVRVLFRGRPVDTVALRQTRAADWSDHRAVVDLDTFQYPGTPLKDQPAVLSALRFLVQEESERALNDAAARGEQDLKPRLLELLRVGLQEPPVRQRLLGEHKALMALPLFRTAGGGERSLGEVIAAPEVGVVVGVPPDGELDPDWLLLHPVEHAVVEGYRSGPTVNQGQRLRERAAQRGRLLRAPKLDVTVRPAQVLVGTEVHAGPVVGSAWIAASVRPGDKGTLRVAREGREVYAMRLELPVDVRLTHPKLAPSGEALVAEDGALEEVLGAALHAAEGLFQSAVRACARGECTGEQARVVRWLALQEAAERWDERGPEAFQRWSTLFETALFTRADGHGAVSLRALIEDHQADGEVGYLADVAPNPDALGRDLAVVASDPQELAAWRRLFPRGFVDYRARVTQAPARAFAEVLRAELDKAVRAVPHAGHRRALAGLVTSLRFQLEGTDWLTATEGTVTLALSHPRLAAIQAAHARGAHVAVPVLAAIAQRGLEPEEAADALSWLGQPLAE